MSKLVKIKGQIPEITNSGKITSRSHKVIRLKTRLNNPRVKILRGRVIVFKTGFTKAFNNPSTKAQKTNISVVP